jgi:release factor glutamine methyltransferase
MASPLPRGLSFDLIVSNPPYVPSAEIETLAPEVRDHDPRLALDGGADGLDFYRRLAAEAASHLRPGGRIMLEAGDGQAEQIRRLFVQHKWVVESVEADYTARPRILTLRSADVRHGPAV